MYKHLFVVVVALTFLCSLYGVFNIFLEVEENACRMTYMFDYPQFSRVDFKENKQFPNYGLYFYYEGNYEKNVNKMRLNGAPVLFIPGNSGSHKQARSLASVALQKAKDSDSGKHLDYFTIDYHEELSGLHGGYLENQRAFLKLSINKILTLYRHQEDEKRKVVLIGHSMGGKLAQAVLTDERFINKISTIIFISTPIHRAVFMFDEQMYAFYRQTNEYFAKEFQGIAENAQIGLTNKLQDILLISIGGGNRDLLVRPALTTSLYSDIHAMTSSIPNVWLSCDHLSAVWCLQLMLVINRFLFSILHKPAGNYWLFQADKQTRLKQAEHYFVQAKHQGKVQDFKAEAANVYSWHEDHRRTFNKQFAKGLRETYHELLPLKREGNYDNNKDKLYVEVLNEDNNDWLFSCKAQLSHNNAKICYQGDPLAHFVERIPSKGAKSRAFAVLDLHNIRKTYRNTTHILLRLPPTEDALRFNIDVFNPVERVLRLKAPRWHDMHEKQLVNETKHQTIYYKLEIQDLIEPFMSFSVKIEASACKYATYYVTTKLNVPWASGFERFNHISHDSNSKEVIVNVPIGAPSAYNTSNQPATLEIFLDPSCRYGLSYKFAIAATMSRLVLEFYAWLPAHLTTVLLVVLKNQVVNLNAPKSTLRTVKPYLDFFQYTSLYIVTGCRLFKMLVRKNDPLETRETIYTFYAAFFVHCFAIVACILCAAAVWLALILQGNFFLKIIMKLTRTSMTTSSAFMSIVSHLPIAFGALGVSLALGTCGGVASVLGCATYFILISDAYKDYLEDLMLKLAANVFKKVTKRSPAPSTALVSEESQQAEAAESADDEPIEGMQNFAFHMTMLLLLCMHALLNITGIIAWVKNYKSEVNLPDPSLVPSIILLCVLSALWQLKAPRYFTNSHYGNAIVAFILYCCSTSCLIFCQDASYRLSYIISFVFVIMLANEILHRLWQLCSPTHTVSN